MTDPNKIGDLLRSMYSYSGSPVTQAALKLAPMLFVRPGELRKARWADIDFPGAEWRFTTSKTGTPHIVPLATQAKEILEDLQPLTRRSEFVFPGVRSAKRPMSENIDHRCAKVFGLRRRHHYRARVSRWLVPCLMRCWGFDPTTSNTSWAHAVRDPLLAAQP